MMEIKTGLVQADGVEMEYFSFGTGARDMVILPGIDVKSILPSAQAVARAYSAFADDYTVYVFDRRRNLPGSYSIREMAADTALCMRELGIRDAYIFGASQGGMMTQYIMIDSPDLARAAVLGSTACRRNETICAVIGRWIALAEQGDIRALTGDFIDNLYSERTVGRFRDFLMHMNDGVGAEDLARFCILARSIHDFDCYDALANVSTPALVIGVEGDRVVTGEASRELSERLGCELFMYGDEYAHCVFDEAKDYAQRIKAFFDKN